MSKRIDRVWKDVLNKTYSKPVFMTTTPIVTEVARRYFNCPSLEGAELEKKETDTSWEFDSSHWSSRVLRYELMAPEMSFGAALSEFTLGIIKDIGWYDVDMSKAEKMVIRPKGTLGCSVAQRSCFDVFKEINQQSEMVNRHAAPYCVPGKYVCNFSFYPVYSFFSFQALPVVSVFFLFFPFSLISKKNFLIFILFAYIPTAFLSVLSPLIGGTCNFFSLFALTMAK